MPTYTLPRTGDVPLRFEGESIANVSTRPDDPSRFARWYELSLYRTKGGTYIIAIGYRSHYGDRETDRAVLCATPDGIRDELQMFDPLADVSGFPPGPAYRDKQERMERLLRLDWETAIRDLFADAEVAGEFAEEIS